MKGQVGMKKVIKVILCIAVLGMFVGCASTNASKISAPVGAVTKTIVATPEVVKGEKISGESNVIKILGGLIVLGDTKYADGVSYSASVGEQETGVLAALAGIFGGASNDRAKAAAAYRACQDNQADIILCPSYVMDNVNYVFFTKTKAQITGFKGTISGIKTLETKDYLEMKYKGE